MSRETPSTESVKTYFDGILTATDTGRKHGEKPIMSYRLTGNTPSAVPPYPEGQRYVIQTGKLSVSTDGKQWKEYGPNETCTIPPGTNGVWLAVETGTEATYERYAGIT